jgi:hypothetical protein
MRFCKRVSYPESLTVKNPLDFNRASRIVSADSQNALIAHEPFWLMGNCLSPAADVQALQVFARVQ